MATLVPAVERAIRILNVFKDSQVEFGVSELSQLLDINKSTVHGIVQTLSSYRMLEQNPSSRKYSLGLGLIELGGLAQTRRDIRQIARPALIELMQLSAETVLLGIFEHGGITVIDVVEPPRELKIAVATGQRMPFSAGSFGRAFAAWMTDQEVDELLADQGLRQYTKTSITNRASYKAALKEVRQNGYALDDTEEYLEGVWAVSAPIRSGEDVQAVVTVVGFVSRITAAERRAAIRATLEAAQQISQSTGLTFPGES